MNMKQRERNEKPDYAEAHNNRGVALGELGGEVGNGT